MEINIFWKNKKVFITGHTGFKGSWMSAWLYLLGAKVTGFSKDIPSTPSLYEDANISEMLVKSIFGDIGNYNELSEAIKQSEPDIVIHMAAQSLVKKSYIEPVNTYMTNVMGTVHLLEAVRYCKSVRAVVNVTSDKCYENKEWYWGYRENEPMGGVDPYSNSKGCSELVTLAYRHSFFANTNLLLASVRAGNVIGGGDWAKDRLIPDVINAFTKGVPLKVRSPNAIRPWQFVLEPIKGYMMIAEKLYSGDKNFAKGWNFGPENHDIRSVSWVVTKLQEQWGENAQWIVDSNEQPYEANLLSLDHSMAKHELNWSPILDLNETLKWLVEWYKNKHEGKNVREMTIKQIQRFQSIGKNNVSC